MKLVIASALIATLSTAAFAGTSDRYNDVRLDTAKVTTHAIKSTAKPVAKATRAAPQKRFVVFSSRGNKNKTKGEGFIFGGFGKGNDSR